MPASASNNSTIIGRDREQQRLRDLLQQTIDGHGGLVLVSGEAGIGKTTLVRDFVAYASEQGTLVLTGGCYDLTTTPPYGPWTQAIREYVSLELDPPPPDWFGNPEAIEQIGSQAALFEETRHFLAAVAARQPLVILLEDLHWADQASCDALRALARALSSDPVLLVVTYRDDELTRRHPFFQLIPLLVREADAHRIELRRWKEPDTRSLLASCYNLPEGNEDRLAGYLQGLAEGNPFYTMELLRTLEANRTLHRNDDGWTLGELHGLQVPPLVRQVIERRLERLSEETRRLLEVAAVIGQRVSFDLWQDVAGVDDQVLLNAVREGLQAQLIDELPDHSGIQFRHALVRETIHAGLLGLQLRALHLQVAEALIEQPNPDPDRLAHHFQQANDDRAIDWLIKAGERARRTYAWLAAIERFEATAELLEQIPDRELDYGWMLFEVAELRRYVNLRKGIQYAVEASRIGEQHGDFWLAALASWRAEFLRATSGDRSFDLHRGISTLRRIDAGIRSCQYEDSDPGWQKSTHRISPSILGIREYLNQVEVPEDAPITYRWGPWVTILFEVGRFEDAREIGNALVPVGRWALNNLPISTSSTGYADAFLALGVVNALLGKPDVARQLNNEAQQMYSHHSHGWMLARSLSIGIETVALPFYTDEIDFQQELERQLSCQLQNISSVVATDHAPGVGESILASIRGQWIVARSIAERESRASNPLMLIRHAFRTILAYLDWQQGAAEHAWQHINELIEGDPTVLSLQTSVWDTLRLQQIAIGLALDAGDFDTADTWIAALDAVYDRTGAVPGRAEFLLSQARYHQLAGDLVTARDFANQALAQATDPRQPLALIAAHRYLGSLDTLEGSYDNAERRLTAAAHLAEACQAPYELALVQLEQAKLHVAARDIPRAEDLLASAREVFEQLEARPALERAAEVEGQLAALTKQYPDGLTPREVEILCLLDEGLSNRELADQLFISVRTIERHITNIYRKIDVHNRAEAGRYARQHNLAPPPTA